MRSLNGTAYRGAARWIFSACLIVCCALGCQTHAKVVRVEVIKRADWLNGRPLGAAGAYELIHGRVHYAVAPGDPANARITDLALAPRNKDGAVEFSGEFLILRPKDPSKARGPVLFEVANRGGTTMAPFINTAAGQRFTLPDPSAVTSLDDAFVFERGFTLAWAGWQFDVPEGRGIRLSVPTADVAGLVRRSFVHTADKPAYSFPLRQDGGYCAPDAAQPDAELTVRDRIDSPPTVVPRGSWAFARDEAGGAVADPCSVRLSTPLETGRLYEVVYRAQGSPVAGLGFAAVRDFVSYLKHGPRGAALRERPEAAPAVIGYGYSQSGRFLRHFVYDGFNADEGGRQVFDGLLVAAAGAGRGSFNHRFAIPGQAGNSVLDFLRPVDLFPFTDSPQSDPLTRARDGLLARADRRRVTPKIFHVYTSTEYWARAGSLTHTSVDGARDLPLHPNTRLYLVAGTPHAARAPRRSFNDAKFEHLGNSVTARFALRALLVGLSEWVVGGVSPPRSAYPTLKGGEIVALGGFDFPKLPGVESPSYMPRVWRMDYGPDFARTGVAARPRPALGREYVVLVPQVDADGNERSGIRMPHVDVPVATYTGWNHETPRLKNLNYLGGLTGAFFPLPRTAEERAAAKDPRPSVTERYGTRERFLARVRESAQSLVGQRYVLAEDVEELVQQGGRLWDFVMSSR